MFKSKSIINIFLYLFSNIFAILIIVIVLPTFDGPKSVIILFVFSFLILSQFLNIFYYNFLILCLTFSHISDRIKTTKRKENEIEGKEGTSHQKSNDLPKTILRKERYRPPKT